MKTGDTTRCPLASEVAGPTRFELATSGVTGRRSNQLNYDPASRMRRTCLDCRVESAVANHLRQSFDGHRLVGGTGLEPVTAGV